MAARAPELRHDAPTSKRARGTEQSAGTEGLKRTREADGGGETDRGAAMMKEVQARLGSESAYRHFRATLKEALVILKKSSKAPAGTSDQELHQSREQARSALETIKWLFSAPALAAPPSLAEKLIPLLPSNLVDEYRSLLRLGAAP